MIQFTRMLDTSLYLKKQCVNYLTSKVKPGLIICGRGIELESFVRGGGRQVCILLTLQILN